MIRTSPILIAIVALLAAGRATAVVYIVEPDGGGDFATIQEAIDAAQELDVVELANGVYQGEGNRDIDFLGKAITVRSQSGIPDSCVIDCGGSSDEEHRGFSFVSGETDASILEGIAVRWGYMHDGGGITCQYSSPLLVNCILSQNIADGETASPKTSEV